MATRTIVRPIAPRIHRRRVSATASASSNVALSSTATITCSQRPGSAMPWTANAVTIAISSRPNRLRPSVISVCVVASLLGTSPTIHGPDHHNEGSRAQRSSADSALGRARRAGCRDVETLRQPDRALDDEQNTDRGKSADGERVGMAPNPRPRTRDRPWRRIGRDDEADHRHQEHPHHQKVEADHGQQPSPSTSTRACESGPARRGRRRRGATAARRSRMSSAASPCSVHAASGADLCPAWPPSAPGGARARR